MEKTISIIGGDKRLESLANLLKEDGYNVFTYGLEKANLKKDIIKCKSLIETIEKADKVIGPIPITFNNEVLKTSLNADDIVIRKNDLINTISNKTIITGKVGEDLKTKFEEHNNKVIDVLELEEFTILNTIPTVEGAIQVAMQETTVTLCGMKALILGFGRIGKLLSKSLIQLGVDVTCEARKETDLAWIKAYGYNGIHLNDLQYMIGNYDIIFNTIPTKILTEELLKKTKNKVIIIELASLPGGIDKEAAEKLNIKVIEAQGLPGKVAPDTVAMYLKDLNIF